MRSLMKGTRIFVFERRTERSYDIFVSQNPNKQKWTEAAEVNGIDLMRTVGLKRGLRTKASRRAGCGADCRDGWSMEFS